MKPKKPLPDPKPPTPDEVEEDLDRAKKDRERAEALKRKSLLDVIIEQGLAFLLDFFGINDIIGCFTKGDVGSCVGVLMNAVPVGKLFKSGKAIMKGVRRAFTAYRDWQTMIRYADEAIARADQAIALAQSKLDEIAEALAKEKRAGGPPKAGGDSGPHRGTSQTALGGQVGPAVSVNQVRRALGRAGMSVRGYDIVHVPKIEAPSGPAFGSSPHVNDLPVLGPSGRPLIQISDLGLSGMDEAVATIYHEIYHHRSFARGSGPGEESMAESFGQRMLGIFNRRR